MNGLVRSLRRLLFAAGLLALAGCGLFESKDGLTMAELFSFKPTVDVQQTWRYRMGDMGEGVLVPAVVGKSLFVANEAGDIARLDDGRAVWRVSAGKAIFSGVASDGHLVVVGTRQGDVLAFSAQDGAFLWKARASSELLAPAVLTTHGVVVRSADNTVALYAHQDGKRLWVYTRNNPSLALRSYAPPVVLEPFVFVGFPGGKLTALNLQNGALAWEGAVALPRGSTEIERVTDILASPWVDDQRACAVAYQGKVACFDVSNGGSTIWSREFSSGQGVVLDNRYLFAVDERSAVHAFDREFGHPIWKNARFHLRQLSTPLVMPRRGFLVLGDAEGYVHLLDREIGQMAARVKTDGSAIVSPPQSIGHSSFVVQTRDGGVFAFEVQ